ncbi:MAG TPA: GNAT family N-acetyltransferase [Stellaceae bacterium]|nr:GNAT family N-acetyltransferase [Stellaceae bacterium]
MPEAASPLRLVPPSLERLPGYVAALAACWSPDTTQDVSASQLAEIRRDPAAFLAELTRQDGTLRQASGREVPRLPSRIFWLDDGEFCGVINLRFVSGSDVLPDYVSGHIGYAVVPWKRRCGYATRALALMLPVARDVGLSGIEITCDEDNEPSRRVILRNGGVFAGTRPIRTAKRSLSSISTLHRPLDAVGRERKDAAMSGQPYDAPYLARNAANFASLSPLGFLARSAAIYPDKLAVIDGERRFTYQEFYVRCRRFGDALRRRGIGPGDTVAVMAPNVPALLEAHYGVPMAGAVLNALNYRLDARSIAFILGHGEAKLLIADREFASIVKPALAELGTDLPLVEIADGENGEALSGIEYEDFLGEGDPAAPWSPPSDEWSAIALNYTSGTTGNPKGVVYHHRGAYLNALGNAITFGLDRHAVYLWTLPMFHCNGWTFTWAVTAISGTHVCLRRVDPAPIFALIDEHKVTHLCGAPVVLNMLVHAPDSVKRRFDHVVEVATGGSAPPSPVIEAMERMGFRVTHLYGLTECYGPSTSCAWQEEWGELPLAERVGKMARQGVQYLTLDGQRVVDPETMQDVPADAATIGELMLRSNTMMKGYLKNPAATTEAFAGGWFHTGDLAVMHPDGYAEIKDRSKDIIISGGENISSIEVEEVLYRHPQVMEAAVVAKPDEKWGEIPCAFVTLKPDAGAVSAVDIIAFCRANLAHYKVPKAVVFGQLPKTSTGKIQKYALRDRAKEAQS